MAFYMIWKIKNGGRKQMMLFIITGIFIAIGIIMLFIEYKGLKSKNKKIVEFFEDEVMYGVIAWLIIIFASLTLMVLSLIKININLEVSAKYAKNKQHYEALLYKAETASIRDEFGIINEDYIDEIEEWNTDISIYLAYSKNFWLKTFYPKEVYEGMNVIDYNLLRWKNKNKNNIYK